MSHPADLSKEYGAPFSIISHKEGSRYTSLVNRRYTPPRSLDFQLIQSRGWTDAIDAHCRTLGFEKIVQMKGNGYEQLMLEFYTTVNFSNADDAVFSCRLMGKNVTLTPKSLREIFGLPKGGHKTVPESFDPEGFFREISYCSGDFKNGKTYRYGCLIKDPTLLLMYRFISHVVFGRAESGKARVKDLFYLWCLRRDVQVDTARFLIATLKSVAANRRANMCLGNFITAIAVRYCKFDPSHTDMKVLPVRALCLVANKMTNVFKEKEGSASASCSSSSDEDTNPVDMIGDQPANLSTTPPPAVDTWMLMKQMHTRMNDGFNDLKSGFDGLEKKVNAMCALIQTFQQEWAGSRQVRESNGTKNVEKLNAENKTIEMLKLEKSESDKAAGMYKAKLEKMSTRIKKIEEGFANISSMKVVDLVNFVKEIDLGTFEEGENLEFPDSRCKNDSLENRSMPDVDAKDVAELLTSNSIGIKGSSKNGNINSMKGDIARTVKTSPRSHSGHNLPQPPSNELIEPLGTAARDIIILDSDDETKPKGAAENSKRDIGSDDTNLVQGSKRKSMESLFASTKRNKDVMMR